MDFCSSTVYLVKCRQDSAPANANMTPGVELFFSYSHRDEALRDELANHLRLLERQGLLTTWHDRKITAGSEWAGQIDQHLEQAKIILLLISADFLASDYCYDIELNLAMERHRQREAVVIPVILRPVDWQGTDFRGLQALPQNAKPVTIWNNQDEAFADISKGIREVVTVLSAPIADVSPPTHNQAKTELNTSNQEQPYYSSTQEPKTSVEKRPIPCLLPYLANRSDQEYRLSEAMHQLLSLNTPKPFICIVHGDELQCHDMFLGCLKKVSLPKILSLEQGTSITDYPLRWPTRLENISELNSRLRKNLADTVLTQRFASEEEINKRLAAHPGPVIVHTHLLTRDWQKHGSQVAEGFLRFWQQWPTLTSQQNLIICLFIKYQMKRYLGWFKQRQFKRINRKISKELELFSRSNFSRFDRLIGTVLPELTNVTQTEVENWARKEETRRFLGEEMIERLIDAIGELFEDWERRNSSSDIPMKYLAESLTNLLETCPLERYL